MTTTTLAPHSFTAADRCDRCGAQAFIRAVLTAGELSHTTGLHVPVDAGVATAFLR